MGAAGWFLKTTYQELASRNEELATRVDRLERELREQRRRDR
jgi:hypothetical protein